MPDDATGLHRAAVHHEARSSSALREVAEADAAAAHAQGAAFHLEDSSPATSDGAAGGSSAGSTAASDDALVGGLTGGGLLAAGLLATLWRSRRRPGTDVDDEQSLATEAALRVGADLDRARGVDATLRRLAEACAAEDLPLPGVFAVRVESARVEPAARTGPRPRTPRLGGRRRRLLLGHRARPRRRRVRVDTGPVPQPGQRRPRRRRS
ncbi:hypothetical protein GCM10025868_35380 [Angustibacter aerolatus]|uniref:Uncharacterized protein n=1 Tax=Angustibacter aerolatus TaxID=1162965 RepID=A0ABQ6JJA1_9ACTN|nr:hypothetical protein [Angustibacter aerolatus]GMA88288.1 hypothetical protein GCM10025868_35380 [Angustibacter aerolatus]